MSKQILRACAMAGLVLAMGSVAVAADNWLGTWKLNVPKSKFSPGPPPQSQTVKFDASEGGFKFASETTDAEGKSMSGGYTAKFDGKDYAWKNNPNADTVAIKRIDDSTYESTWKKSGNITVTSRVSISRDGRMLTNTQMGKNAQGQAVHHTLIYEKQ